MTHAVQELGHGIAPSQKYGDWGVTGEITTFPLESIYGAVFGQVGVGKTSLFRDIEGCLHLNFDGTSTPIPHTDSRLPPPKWMTWPAYTAEGRPMPDGPDTKPRTVTWKDALSIRDRIAKAASESKPVPRMVVIDSMGTLYNTVMEHVFTHQKEYALIKEHEEPRENPSKLDGRKFYGAINGLISSYARPLIRSGIGVWLIGHTAMKSVDDKTQEVLTVTDGLWSAIKPEIQMAGVMGHRTDITYEDVEESISVRGKEVTRTISKPVKREVRWIRFDSEGMTKITKERAPIRGEIHLPPVNAWEELNRVYRETITHQ